MYYTYILKSKTTNRHYIGSTEDLSERLIIHNKGKVRSTKSSIPWEIIYSETFETRSEAFKREQFFKTIDGYNWLKENKIR